MTEAAELEDALEALEDELEENCTPGHVPDVGVEPIGTIAASKLEVSVVRMAARFVIVVSPLLAR